MGDIRRLLRRAAVRLSIQRFLTAVVALAAIAFAALTLLRVAERLLAFNLSWGAAWIAAAGLIVVGALAWTIARWPGALRVAMLVDERARLREALSTAESVADHGDPWSRLVVADAQTLAQHALARSVTPISAPRQWPAAGIALALFVGVWLFLPQWDLLGALARADARDSDRQAVEQARQQVEQMEKELANELAKLRAAEFGEDLKLDAEPTRETPVTPDDIRRSALQKMTTLRDRLDSLQSGVKGKTLEGIRSQLANVRRPGPGPLDELAKALQQGNMKAANEALANLSKRLAEGALSKEEQARLAEQLQTLAEQLAQASKSQQTLADALANAGLDPKLASNPTAALQAIQNAQGLSSEQRQALAQMAQAAANAQQSMQALAQAMQQAGQQMQGNLPGALVGLSAMGDALSDLEMLEADLAAAQAASFSLWGKINALGQGMGGQCLSPAMLQQWRKIAKGATGGGAGTAWSFGADVDQPLDPSAFNTARAKARSKVGAGPVIGSRLVQGEQIRGEAQAAFVEAIRASSQAAADAIDANQIPREHRDAVRHYFGRLEEKVRAERAGDKKASGSGPS